MDIKDMTEEEKEQRVKEILDAFRYFDGRYKREEVDDAIELKEEITPYLIEILEVLLADPEKYIENDDRFDHIYAAMLLGHFKESKAHKLIVDIFSLPSGIPYQLFEDSTTEDLPIILLNTCGGSVEAIKSLILNKEAYEFCRGASAEALTFAVLEGYTTREETLTFLASLFTGDEAEQGSMFWSLIANAVCDLYPAEVMDTIRQAYNDNLIDTYTIDLKDFQYSLNRGEEDCLYELKKNQEVRNLKDIHQRMSWWDCFRDDTVSITPRPPSGKNRKKILAKKKNKAKQAKASKRKNRARKK